MSEAVNSRVINHTFTSDDPTTNFKSLMEVVAQSSDHLTVRDISTDSDIIYRVGYTVIPNLEVGWHIEANASQGGYSGIDVARIDPETKEDLVVKTWAKKMQHGANNFLTADISAAITIAEFDNRAMFVHVAFTATTRVLTAMFIPLTHRFTNEQVDAIYVFGANNDNDVSRGASMYPGSYLNGSTFTFTPIGGTSYPLANGVVATPVAITNSSINFYGYALDSDWLYMLYQGTSEFKPTTPLFKTSIGGHTFVYINNNMFARLD